jgi:zona occludens toxin (predicted ATPase)
MAIYVVTGKPGSGKSLFAVRHLRDNYLQFEDKGKEIGYKVKEGFQIISNISGLSKRVPQIRFLDDILKYYDISQNDFFKYDFQKFITESDYPFVTEDCKNNPEAWPTKKDGEHWKIIYLIDEAQQLWSSRHTTDFKDSEQKESLYFQKHRHLGHTLYIMTQEITTLWPKIWKIAEMEIRAVPKSLTPPGFFLYKYKIPHTQTVDKVKWQRIDKRDFALYKSFDVEQSEKQGKNKKIIFVIPITIIIFITGLFYFYKNIKGLHNFVTNEAGKTGFSQKSVSQTDSQPSPRNQVSHQPSLKKNERLTKLNIIKLYQGDKVISSKVVDPDSGNMVELKEYIAQGKREIKIMNSEVYVYLPTEEEKDRKGRLQDRTVDIGL